MSEVEINWDDPVSVFNLYDLDKNGALDESELESAMTAAIGKKITTAECEKLLVEFDENHDGVLQLEEFVALVAHMKKKMGKMGHKWKRASITKMQNTMAVKEAREQAVEAAASLEDTESQPPLPTPPETPSREKDTAALLSSASSSSAPPPPSPLDFIDTIPDERLQKLVRAQAESLAPSEIADLASLFGTIDKFSTSKAIVSPTKSQVKLVVDIMKHRITPELRAEALGMFPLEETAHVNLMFKTIDAVSAESLLTVAGTALRVYGITNKPRAAEEKLDYHDFEKLVEEKTVLAAVDIIASLPPALLDEVQAKATASDEEKLTEPLKIVRRIISQPSDRLAKIITPALLAACKVAELTALREKDTGDDLKGAIDTNAEMNQILEVTAPLIAKSFVQLMALPQELKDDCLAQMPEEARKAAAPVLELTAGMREKDVEELFITMAKEAFPAKQKPVSAPVAVTMSIDKNFNDVVGQPDKKREFERAFIKDLAKSLNVDPSRIKISSLTKGSVVVKFEISGTGEDGHAGEDQTAADLAQTIQEQVADPSSPLYNGSVTASIKKGTELGVEELPIPEETEEDREKKKKAEWQKTKAKFLTVAKVVARTETRRLAHWVYESPTSLRVLGFLSGFLVLVSSVFSLVMDLFSGQFSAFMISFWLILLSLLLVLYEAKIQALQSYVLVHIEKYFQLMSYVSGRGYYLVFLGLLACSLITKGAWQNSLDLGAGALCVLVGLVTIYQGRVATRSANALKGKLENEETVRAKFASADANGNGALDLEELGELCHSLGSQMSAQQLECVLRSLDADHNGGVDVEEFVAWWKQGKSASEAAGGGDVEEGMALPEDQKTEAQAVVDMKLEIKQTPTALRVVNVGLALCVVLSGVVGAVSIWTNHPESIVLSVIDCWVALAGFAMLFFEAGAWCACCNYHGDGNMGEAASQKIEALEGGFNAAAIGGVGKGMGAKKYLVEKYFRFLDTVAGRGVFYVFVSALCVASYEEDVGAEGLLGVFTGIGVMAVAAANVVVGVKANEKFKELRGKVGEGSLRDLFEGADEDRSGFLDLSELAAFCRSPGVGIELNHRQWEMLVMEMDADGNGKISFEEFKAWYGRGV